MEELLKLLFSFKKIQLDELNDANLMRRMDIKFVFNEKHLYRILAQLKDQYDVLEVNQQPISQYKSLYFDTPNFQFYTDHHNQKNHRFKVRYRTYLNGNITFFEIKEKRKGVTDKRRIPVEEPTFDLTKAKDELSFYTQILPQKNKLIPVLWNSYKRITLVHKEQKERITFDLSLSFEWEGNSFTKKDLVIAELKQEKLSHASFFYQLMKKEGIRPFRLSKYCLGILNLHSDKRIKHNRFKQKLLKLKSIT